MSEDKLEKISALMDGELGSTDREAAIESIEVDPETQGSWQRYHMIGDTMRNTMPSSVKSDLATKLNEMLENEPAILAPKPTPITKKITERDYFKPLAGLAIAASITAVAIMGLQTADQQVPGLDSNSPQVASSEQGIQQVSPPVIPNTVRTVKYEPVENTIEAKRLNPYILNHNQFNSRMGVQGVSPNARLVGHESQR